MQTWFECGVQLLKIDQGGYERKVTDNYLFDAVSFTDAETRVYEQMKQITNGEFRVKNIKQSNITEVLPSDYGEWWYKAKISLVTVDEEAGREKKTSNYILVQANNLKAAVISLEKGLEYLLVPYTLDSLAITTIADIFPYNLAEGVAKMEAAEAENMQEESEGDE